MAIDAFNPTGPRWNVGEGTHPQPPVSQSNTPATTKEHVSVETPATPEQEHTVENTSPTVHTGVVEKVETHELPSVSEETDSSTVEDHSTFFIFNDTSKTNVVLGRIVESIGVVLGDKIVCEVIGGDSSPSTEKTANVGDEAITLDRHNHILNVTYYRYVKNDGTVKPEEVLAQSYDIRDLYMAVQLLYKDSSLFNIVDIVPLVADIRSFTRLARLSM